jgi:hypothetical protein
VEWHSPRSDGRLLSGVDASQHPRTGPALLHTCECLPDLQRPLNDEARESFRSKLRLVATRVQALDPLGTLRARRTASEPK